LGGDGQVAILWAITCRIAARRLRRDAGATGHNVRERGTGERRDAGRERLHLPDRGQRLRCPRREAGAIISTHEKP